jgi:hypothetical protein
VEITSPVENFRTRSRFLLVEGITEPGATVVINTETVTLAGQDGRFASQITLEDGQNRVNVRATDRGGLSGTDSVEVVKVTPPPPVKQDMSSAMTATGILAGLGIIFPIGAAIVAARGRKHRREVLASLTPPAEAAPAPPKEPEIPTAPTQLVEQTPPPLPPPPPPEYYQQAQLAPPPTPPQALPPPEQQDGMTPMPFAGLQAKNTELEVSAGDTDSPMSRPAPQPYTYGHAPPQPAPEQAQAGLRDKRAETEYGAGEIEQAAGPMGRPRQ